MPNTLAYLTLLAWPAVSLMLFLRLPRASAVLWTILAGMLLLPAKTSFDPPLLPPLDRDNGPALIALVWAALGLGRAAPGPRAGPGWLPRSALARLLLLLLLVGPILTVATNRDPVFGGPTGRIPGLSWYDAGSMIQGNLILIVPLLLGRRFFGEEADHRAILRAMAVCGLILTLPALLEIRLSPQIHKWVYGFYPSMFAQHIRFDGFRPQVFFTHSLGFASFMMGCAVCAATLWRAGAGRPEGRIWLGAFLWLAVVLVLCKSVGPIMLALAALGPILVGGARLRLAAAAAMAVFVLAYPLLRQAGVISNEMLLAPVETYLPSKLESFEMRVVNEWAISQRAAERPLFGWGIWARWRIFDAVTGEDLTISDGRWAITLGTSGAVGFAGLFGLLALPLLKLFRWRSHPEMTGPTTGMALLVAVWFVNLIPNASLTPMAMLMTGALLGRAERIAERAPAPAGDRPTVVRPRPRALIGAPVAVPDGARLAQESR